MEGMDGLFVGFRMAFVGIRNGKSDMGIRNSSNWNGYVFGVYKRNESY